MRVLGSILLAAAIAGCHLYQKGPVPPNHTDPRMVNAQTEWKAAVERRDYPRMRQLLQEARSSNHEQKLLKFEAKEWHGSAVMFAVIEKDADLLRHALELGVSPDSMDWTGGGRSALKYCATAGWFPGLEVLLRSGANPDITDDYGITLLQNMAHKPVLMPEEDMIRVARLLLQYGADPNHTDDRGRNALHFCAYSGNWQIAKLLLDSGVNREKKARLTLADGQVHEVTPLELAEVQITYPINAENGPALSRLIALLKSGQPADFDALE